jgi:hypothetical protein
MIRLFIWRFCHNNSVFCIWNVIYGLFNSTDSSSDHMASDVKIFNGWIGKDVEISSMVRFKILPGIQL